MHKRTSAAATKPRAVGHEGGKRRGKREMVSLLGFLFITATCIAFFLYAFNAISTLFTLIYAQASECLKGARRTDGRRTDGRTEAALNDKPQSASACQGTLTHTHMSACFSQCVLCALCFLLPCVFCYLPICLFVCLSRLFVCLVFVNVFMSASAAFIFCDAHVFVRGRLPFVCRMTARSPLCSVAALSSSVRSSVRCSSLCARCACLCNHFHQQRRCNVIAISQQSQLEQQSQLKSLLQLHSEAEAESLSQSSAYFDPH